MSPIEFQGVKLHRFTRGFRDHEPISLSLGCKWLPNTPTAPTSFDLKSFIKPESGPRIVGCPKRESPQVEAQSGGTRWNPTQEQIGILEMLYRSGMRTPNAQQIEQITLQLAQYGKIEGKNVFYWFQNHKARERQKQKRNSLGLVHTPRTTTSPLITTRLLLSPASGVEEEISDGAPCKRKCKSWGVDRSPDEANENQTSDEEVENRTLKLFPLHPQGRC